MKKKIVKNAVSIVFVTVMTVVTVIGPKQGIDTWYERAFNWAINGVLSLFEPGQHFGSYAVPPAAPADPSQTGTPCDPCMN